MYVMYVCNVCNVCNAWNVWYVWYVGNVCNVCNVWYVWYVWYVGNVCNVCMDAWMHWCMDACMHARTSLIPFVNNLWPLSLVDIFQRVLSWETAAGGGAFLRAAWAGDVAKLWSDSANYSNAGLKSWPMLGCRFCHHIRFLLQKVLEERETN